MFVVSKLLQYMHQPCDSHVVAAKRYLNGTTGRGLMFQKEHIASLRLRAYSDSNWSSDPGTNVQLQVLLSSLGQILFHGELRNNPLFLKVQLRLNIGRWLPLQLS